MDKSLRLAFRCARMVFEDFIEGLCPFFCLATTGIHGPTLTLRECTEICCA